MFDVPSEYIAELLRGPADTKSVEKILDTVRADSPLSMEDAASLLHLVTADSPESIMIIKRAGDLRNEVFGRRVKLFIPLYLSNDCVNDCLYCAYRKSNNSMSRRTLTPDEFRLEMEAVTGRGYRVIELVTSESTDLIPDGVLEDYIGIARQVLDETGQGESELILMSWVLPEKRFETLAAAGLDAFYLWQETYDQAQFERLHPSGNSKRDFESRVDIFDRAVKGGVRKVGLGVLFGLGEWKREVLSLIAHGRYLESEYGISPDAIGIPRFKHADGAPMSAAPYPVSDGELKLAVAIYRMAFPQSNVFLNTREKLNLMLDLLDGGGSEMNIACAVYPGGYTKPSTESQFDFYNYPTERTLRKLEERGYEAAQYVIQNSRAGKLA